MVHQSCSYLKLKGQTYYFSRQTKIGRDYAIHSFRHSMRDRLSAAECPSDVIDQIGGWLTHGVGHAYGKGYPANILAKQMGKACINI